FHAPLYGPHGRQPSLNAVQIAITPAGLRLYHRPMRRLVQPEFMDDPAATREELRTALAYIRWVNRVLGESRALIGHLARWSRRWPKDRPVTLLDVGTGSADIPLEAVRWARQRGFDLRVTAVDLHP